MPKGPKAAAGRFVVKMPETPGPLWKGPESADKDGGITFSMLKRFLDCPERFRVKYVLGLTPAEKFSRVMEYGQMWHVCEEALAAGVAYEAKLDAYAEKLYRQYPFQREEIAHWVGVCKVQFPVYVDYWAKQGDVLARTPLLQEATFKVPYKLSSGRVVYLRGKFDSVDLIGTGKEAGIYLQENKTKGDIDEAALVRQLTFDLQTMIYLTALHGIKEGSGEVSGEQGYNFRHVRRNPVLGVRYNVVRRPLSGGEGTIVQRKGSKNVAAETLDEFLDRVRGVIDGTGKNQKGENYKGPAHFFMRWKVEVPKGVVDRFRHQCLDPLLERLCRWYEHVTDPVEQAKGIFGAGDGIHYRHPFGADSSINNYGASDVDHYLDTGDEVGLRRRSKLFEELD